MLTSSSNMKSNSQTPPADHRDQGRTDSSAEKPSNYYYDDSTGYEIYRDEDEEDDEPETREPTD